MQILLKAVNYSGSGPWLDESGNGKDATLLEGSYSKNTGGNGIILNGSTSWTFPNVALGNSWTASVWYKNTGSTTPNAACILAQLYGEASASSSVLIGYLYNNSGFNTSISGGFVGSATSYNGSLITLTNGIWTNIQVTWNGISMRTYINGTAIADTTPGGISIDSTSSYLIGGSYVPYGNFMTGEIGEVRIYNYPLTQAQVTADYTSSLPTFQNLMILLKAVNYGGSGAWIDESGNGFNATKENGTIAKNIIGNGIVLNGSTNWTFPNVGLDNAWTASVWYKNTGSPGENACILTQNFTGSSINTAIGYVSNSLTGGFFNGSWRTGTTITLTDRIWTNIQVTWEGTNLRTYINAALLGTTQPGETSLDSGNAYRIGRTWDNPNYMIGEIGEVRMYNYPLTQTQVTSDYNSSLPTFQNLMILLKAVNYSGSGAWNDESGNGFNATKENGTIAKNVIGNGIVLDGSTNWTFPNVAVGPKWTASVWYKNTGAPVGDNACILTQMSGSMNLMIGYVNSLSGGFYNGSTGWSLGNPITLTDNVWTNIQVTWDGTNMSTYINGNLLGTTTPGGTSEDSTSSYRIGRRWDSEDYMVGEIGEVRIYNDPLTQAQVNADLFSSYYTFNANSVPYPPLIHIRPKVTNNAIRLNWQPPALNGGTTITNYTLTSPQDTTRTISSTQRLFDISGLTNGTQYTYSLAAVNNLGTGSNATFRTVRPGPRSSQLVSSPTAVINGSNVTINWNAFSGQNTNNIQWTVAKTQLLSGNGSLPKFNVQFGQTSMTAATGLDLANNRYKFSLHYVNDPGYSVPTFTNAVGTGTYTFIRPTTLPLYNTGLLRSVASSADANRIITCISGNKFWASTDKGITWTQNTTIENNGWNGIVCSSNGTRFLAIDGSNGFVWFSSNSGATWTSQTSLGEKNWSTIAISSNGNYAAAGVKNGYIYTGTFDGSIWSWTEQTGSGTRYWASLVISDDGTTLYAGENKNPQYQESVIWKSTNSGVDWVKIGIDGTTPFTSLSTFSADGTKMYAARVDYLGGGIFSSSNSGKTWTHQANSSVIGGIASLSCSANGEFLVATNGSTVYTSSNSGVDWTSVFAPSGYSNIAAACNTTGETIYAIGQDADGVYIWKSIDSGSTWGSATYVSNTLVGDSRSGNFVCSKDGVFLYFSISYGNIWVSYNSGATWTEFTTDPPGESGAARYLSCSDDGYTICISNGFTSYKGVFNGTSAWTWSSISLNDGPANNLTVSGNGSVFTAVTDKLYKSTNGGSTWTGYSATTPASQGRPTVSYDGSIILINTVRPPLVTVNGGTNWYTLPTPGEWSCIRMSADKTKIIVTNVFGNNDSYIYLSTDSGLSWTLLTAAGSRFWTSITVSADFTKMAATARNNFIYYSTDSGATWTQVTSTGTQVWTSITGDSTGQYLTAVVNGGTIWVSHDYGALWYSYVETPSQICRATAISRNASTLLTVSPVPYISNNGGLYWRPLNIFNQTDPNNFLTASAFVSTDGSFVAIAIHWSGNLNGGSPYIMTSANYGYSWTQRTSSGQRPWTGITGSSNGSKLAAVADSENIYVSADSGATWSSVATQQSWRGIASSDNGTFLVACTTNSGSIWTSSNSGTDWTDQTNAGSGNWSSVACNTTGATIFATQNTGYIYKSSDSGVTWAQLTTDTARTWTNISCSPDGVYIVATEGAAYIWISPDGGLTWNYQAGSASTNLNSASVALNGDGVRIIAANNNSSYIMLGDI
jgi:hypothetical protein